MINFENKEQLKAYLSDNLLPAEEGRLITQQSLPAFNQAVAHNRITPFFQTVTPNGRIQNKLYLRSELEEYSKTKKI